MRRAGSSLLIAGMLTAVAGVALSQPMMGAGGFMHGNGPGMMGRGGGYSGPAGYLDDLKAILGITAAEEAAWNAYSDAVKSSAEQMQGVHQTMYEAMGTATWQERRDMMNRMFDVRQEAFEKVHAAAEQLLPSLDASQQQKAKTRLPGLAGPGYGMMRGQFRSP